MTKTSGVLVREAGLIDLPAIQHIYNEGIVDGVATLDTDQKDDRAIASWFAEHGKRYAVLVAVCGTHVVGWAALNRYSPRDAYRGVTTISIYVRRSARGTGIGTVLLRELEQKARAAHFYKLLIFTFPSNVAGQRLYARCGFREVGTFRRQGLLSDVFVDVMAMEKHLVPADLSLTAQHRTADAEVADMHTNDKPAAANSASLAPPNGLPRYRLLTGPDTRAFCERVTEALDLGFQLYGSPAAAWNGTDVIVAQAVVWNAADGKK